MALSSEQVVTTAVDLLRRYGLADLSMRRLARELGVAPGALYWHVANKQELLVEVADVLLAEIPVPPPDEPPVEALVGLAVAIREALVQVPDGADVVGLAYAVEPGRCGRCAASPGSSTTPGRRRPSVTRWRRSSCTTSSVPLPDSRIGPSPRSST